MKLRLAKELFELESIRVAALAYAGLADVSVEDEGMYWACTLSNCRYGEELTAREFENYIIDHMNGA